MRVSEEALGLGRYGKVLTVLHSDRIGSESETDEEQEEQDLRESWTPRFRRGGQSRLAQRDSPSESHGR